MMQNNKVIRCPGSLVNYTIKEQLNSDTNLTLKLIKKSELSNARENDNVMNITNFSEENNLTISCYNEHYIDITGTYDCISKAFNVILYNYEINEKIYYAHRDDIIVPSCINFIDDIFGFNNLSLFKTYYKKQDILTNITEDVVIKKNIPNTLAKIYNNSKNGYAKLLARKYMNKSNIIPRRYKQLSSFTPLQIAKLYNFPNYTGKGCTIAVIQLGGGYLQSELTTYFNSLGLTKHPTIISIGVDGNDNNPDDTSGDSGEVYLDIEILGAIANEATILVYFAPNTILGFYNAIYQAVNNTDVSCISISWGAPEIFWTRDEMNAYNTLFANAVQKNINVFVASGDNGASDGTDQICVDFPASSPNVIACGGTRIVSDGNTIKSEYAWNNHNGNATGGGISLFFAKPKYQNNIKILTTKRGVPDLAGNADPYSGYQIYMQGTTQVFGGTSAVAPLMAGLITRINSRKKCQISFINNKLYVKNICYDIISGHNDFYSTKKKYDCVTGCGRIDGKLAFNNL